MRLVIISNRLQVTVLEKDGEVEIIPSSGGLITGIGSFFASLKDPDYLWIGWPGGSSYSNPDKISKELSEKYHSWPLFVEEKTMDLFYNGFCNKVLWPLFHYFPRLTTYDEMLWENYREVNALFADEVIKMAKPDDIIWVHDYHLMLLPRMIRERMPSVTIGFFLHIPFPSYEIFRQLPRKWNKEILEGLLEANLVGFHTHDYTRYFLRCVLRILGYNHNMGMIATGNRLTKTGTFAMGIDYNKYHDAGNLETVKRERSFLKKDLQNLKIILSVDRQDYTKGILNRLEGYDIFLKNNPEWHQKVVLIMIIVPSRIGLDDYQKAKNKISQLIGIINGDFGNVKWTPVIYQYKSVSFEQLIAFYNISDVGLVTPLRDGMNLVAKEYIAARIDKKGMLILSEMAGTAMELGDAIIINPNHREEIAESIKKALEMPPEEQTRRISLMQDWLKKNDVKKWVTDFLEELQLAKTEQEKFGAIHLEEQNVITLLDRFHHSDKKIIFLDYDGTLVPFASKPSHAVPGRKLLKVLKHFSKIPGIDIVIISGRNRKDLHKWYDNYNMTLVAEHGAWIKRPMADWELVRPLKNDWKPQIFQILENYKGRLKYSFIEEKEFSLVWHFRNSDNTLSGLLVKEFVDNMMQYTSQNEIEVLMGNKVVEIKCSGVSKGDSAGHLIGDNTYDFIMAAGDDETDESLFRILPKGSFTIKIGRQESFADFYLDSSDNLLDLLEKMIDYRKGFLQNFLDFFRT